MRLLQRLRNQKEKNVVENMELNPLTDYSKFKAECEKYCLSINQIIL